MDQVAEKTARPESCPFCRSTLNAGATVCAYCGAFKGSRPISGFTQFSWIIFVFLPVLAGFLSGAMTIQKEILFGIVILAVTLYWFVQGTKWIVGERTVEWLRRN